MGVDVTVGGGGAGNVGISGVGIIGGAMIGGRSSTVGAGVAGI